MGVETGLAVLTGVLGDMPLRWMRGGRSSGERVEREVVEGGEGCAAAAVAAAARRGEVAMPPPLLPPPPLLLLLALPPPPPLLLLLLPKLCLKGIGSSLLGVDGEEVGEEAGL